MFAIQPIEFLVFGFQPQNSPIAISNSVAPNSGIVGTVVNVTVTGVNFLPGTAFSFGAGITVSSLVLVSVNKATMTLTISPTATTGFYTLTTTGNITSTTLSNAFNVILPPVIGTGDFFDYIFQFPDQGSFLRDPQIQTYAPSVLGSQPGVQLLIYNPVETLQQPRPTTGNPLVGLPQLANSSVALPGFWAMLTIQSSFVIVNLANHPNLQILNDRTRMFAGKPSVITTKIDVSHINIVINIFGVYVTDGLKVGGLLLEDGTGLLLEDNTSLLLEGQ